VVQIVLLYLDSGCSKHMIGDHSQLINFVHKFLGTVKFENDHVAKIMGYGDYMIGNVTVSRVYFVEGLGHNLFSVGYSGLVQKPSSSTPYVPPSRNDWDLLFQLMFDELLNPPPSVDPQAPEVIALIDEVISPVPVESTSLPSSTTVDQDAPSPSKSQTTLETQSSVIPQDVEEYIHDIEVAYMRNDSLFGVPILEVTSAQSSSTMSMMGKISFFLGLQISQSPRGIFINQYKYALESLKKYGFESCDPVDTPMVDKSKLNEDKKGKVVDPSHYRGMIGTLFYLTASRPDLQFAICMCARYQARPTEKHIHAVKRIFQNLRGTVNQGLWYLKDFSLALTAFADADHAGCQDTRRITSGSLQFLGEKAY
nr:uncharacterized mitochondrial protein AtMg00810-like [Tanacetum cinerariifolium]